MLRVAGAPATVVKHCQVVENLSPWLSTWHTLALNIPVQKVWRRYQALVSIVSLVRRMRGEVHGRRRAWGRFLSFLDEERVVLRWHGDAVLELGTRERSPVECVHFGARHALSRGTHGGAAHVAGTVGGSCFPNRVVGDYVPPGVGCPVSSVILQSLLYLHSLTSQMARANANRTKNVLKVSTTTTPWF